MSLDEHQPKGFAMQINFDTTKLKRQIEENPLVAAGVGAALLQGAAKLMQANTQRKNSKTWAKEVNRRTQSTK
jgi:hypothetical protein